MLSQNRAVTIESSSRAVLRGAAPTPEAEAAGAGSVLGGQLAHRGSAGLGAGREIGAGEPLPADLPRGWPARLPSDPNDYRRYARH